MEKRACPKCGTLCLGNYICLNCSGDAQYRQSAFEAAHELRHAESMDLRDKFAMAALPSAMLRSWTEDGVVHQDASDPHINVAQMAYAWADLMLKARLPESG